MDDGLCGISMARGADMYRKPFAAGFQARLRQSGQIFQRLQFPRDDFPRYGIENRQGTQQFAGRRENAAGGVKTNVRRPRDQGVITKPFVGQCIGDNKHRGTLRCGREDGQIKTVRRCECGKR